MQRGTRQEQFFALCMHGLQGDPCQWWNLSIIACVSLFMREYVRSNYACIHVVIKDKHCIMGSPPQTKRLTVLRSMVWYREHLMSRARVPLFQIIYHGAAPVQYMGLGFLCPGNLAFQSHHTVAPLLEISINFGTYDKRQCKGYGYIYTVDYDVETRLLSVYVVGIESDTEFRARTFGRPLKRYKSDTRDVTIA